MENTMSGLIHLYIGDGKGKTSAAVGLAVRATGWGAKVAFVSFMKSWETGEVFSLETLGVNVLRSEGQLKFIFQMNDEEKAACRSEQQKLLAAAKLEAEADADLVVLDEVLDAVTTGMLTEDELRDFLANKPDKTEVVVTGRDPMPWLIEISDYVTELQKVKHPYDKGISARKLIEF
jgi:cob(I)alamin adenosyltransferase